MTKRPPSKTKLIQVKVSFEGNVTVEVPADARLPEVLAQKMALSRVLATIDNPDAPDEEASEEYLQEVQDQLGDVDEEQVRQAWDNARPRGVAGEWKVEER